MSVTVAEDGNRRVGGPELAEIRQCVLDAKSWFSRSGWESVEGCTSADLQRLEKTIDFEIPPALAALLSEVNGGLWIMDKQSFGSRRIAEVYAEKESSKKWKRDYVPFAGNDDLSALLLVDSSVAGAAVYEWDSEEDCLGDSVASSFGTFIETYRNDLLSGQFEYLDGCGVIEKIGAAKRK